MKKLTIMQRQDLLSFAEKVVSCPDEEAILEKAYDAAKPIVLSAVLKVFPSKDMKVLERYGASNIYWRVARKYKLEDMPIGTAIQFEVIGPGVQSNPHGLDELEGRLFGVFKQDPNQHMWQKQSYPHDNRLAPLMPRAKEFYFSPDIFWTRESIETACAIYYGNGNPGEGIVFAADDGSWSFKAINPNYKF